MVEKSLDIEPFINLKTDRSPRDPHILYKRNKPKGKASMNNLHPKLIKPSNDTFIVDSIHIGADTIQVIDESGDIIYFPMSKHCQEEQRKQTEAFANFMRQEGRNDLEATDE